MFSRRSPRRASAASSAYADTVSSIIVEGNQRIENDTILSYVQVSAGQNATPEKIDASIKALFQTGLFSDVQITRRGNTLVVKVVENPMINEVNFEGNVNVKDTDLTKEVELKERMMFTRAKVLSDVNRIIAVYRRAGYYSVQVSPKIIRLPENRVNLVFEINEGGETKVKQINFVGNKAFSAGDLKSVIGTQQYSWWRFFNRNDNYDADRLEYDKELLRRYYLQQRLRRRAGDLRRRRAERGGRRLHHHLHDRRGPALQGGRRRGERRRRAARLEGSDRPGEDRRRRLLRRHQGRQVGREADARGGAPGLRLRQGRSRHPARCRHQER